MRHSATHEVGALRDRPAGPRACRLLPIAAAVLIAVSLIAGCSGGAGSAGAQWPASSSGRPTLYYFGSGS